MARKKRKKLNKKVVAVLVVLGLGLVAITGLSAYKLWPKDPVALKAQAEAALNEPSENAVAGKNYEEAVRLLGKAIGAAEGREMYIPLCLQYTEWNLEWLDAIEDPKDHERRERLSAAVSGLETARRADPRSEEVLTRLSELYKRMGDYKKYMEVLADLIKVRPNDAELWYDQARHLAVQARVTQGREGIKAIESFEKAIELDPNSPTYRMQFARFLSAYGRETRSEEVYRKAMAEMPSESMIPREFGRFLVRRNRVGAARDQFSVAIQRDPNDPANHLAMATFLMGQRKFDDAEAYLDQGIELDPNAPGPQLIYADLHKAQGELDKAVIRHRKAIELFDKHRDGRKDVTELQVRRYDMSLAKLHSNHADLLLNLAQRQPGNKEKLVAEARASMDVLKKLRPDSAEYAKIRGRIHLMEGNEQKAVKYFAQAHKKYKKQERIDTQTIDFLAALYLQTGRPGKAETLLQELRGAGRYSSMSSLLRAQIEINLGNYARAVEELERVLRVNPTHTQSLNLHKALRFILAEGSRLPEDLDLTSPIRKLLLREAERRWVEGNETQAIALLESMHRREPERPRLINRLASYYRRSGQDEKTRQLLEEASRVHPDNEQIRQALKLLDTGDPDKRYALQMEALEKVEDPIARAVGKAQVAGLYRKREESLKHWKRAANLAMEAKQGPARRTEVLVAGLLRRLQKEGKTQEVEAWLDRAAKANLDGLNGQRLRAGVALVRGDYDQAIRLMKPLAEDQRQSKRIQTLLGRAYVGLQEYEKARNAFEAALADDSAHQAAVLGMIEVSSVLSPDEYPKWVRKAYRLNPQNTKVRAAYLDLQQREQADPAELMAKREQLFESDPRNLANAVRLALLYEENGELKKAESVYRFLYENLKRKVTAAEVLARFYKRQGQMDKAEALLNELRANDELDQVRVNLLAAQLVSSTDLSAAREAINKAMKVDPRDPRPYRALVALWIAAGQRDKAIDAAESLLTAAESTLADEKQLIRMLVDAGKSDEALTRLENLLVREPDDAEALTLKGAILFSQGKRSRAKKAFDRAIELRPRYAEPLRYRALLHERAGEMLEAVSDLRRALELQGRRSTRLRLAKLLVATGDFSRAEQLFKTMLQVNPQDRDALDGLVNLYLLRENYRALEELLASRKEAYPDSTVPYLSEARMWNVRGDDEKQMQALTQAVRIARTPQTFSAYLRGLIDTGRFGQALEAIEGDVPQGMDALLTVVRAAALAGTGKTVDADSMFRDILPRTSPQMLGTVMSMALDGYGRDQGLEKLLKWTALRPRDPAYLIRVARLLAARGTKDAGRRAADLYARVLDLSQKGSPAQAVAFSGLGVVKHHLDDPEGARDAYLKALEINPNDLRSLNNLAYLFVSDLDRPKKGLEYARKAIALQPHNPNILDTYGWALAHVGRLTDARKALERALRQDRSAVMLYHLGWIHEQADRLDDSLSTYRDALVLVDEGSGDAELKDTLDEAIRRVQKKRAEERR